MNKDTIFYKKPYQKLQIGSKNTNTACIYEKKVVILPPILKMVAIATKIIIAIFTREDNIKIIPCGYLLHKNVI